MTKRRRMKILFQVPLSTSILEVLDPSKTSTPRRLPTHTPAPNTGSWLVRGAWTYLEAAANIKRQCEHYSCSFTSRSLWVAVRLLARYETVPYGEVPPNSQRKLCLGVFFSYLFRNFLELNFYSGLLITFHYFDPLSNSKSPWL